MGSALRTSPLVTILYFDSSKNDPEEHVWGLFGQESLTTSTEALKLEPFSAPSDQRIKPSLIL